MAVPYENIRVEIDRARATEIIRALIDDVDDSRARFESDPHAFLAENGIHFDREDMPEEVRLPAPADMEEFLKLLDEKIVSESASPFGFALMIFAFGAMPVLEGDRTALDGTG